MTASGVALIVTLALLLCGASEAARNVQFIVQEVFLNDILVVGESPTTCSGSLTVPSPVLLGRTGECLAYPSPVLANTTVRYSCDKMEVFGNPTCSGTPTVTQDICLVNTGGASLKRTCQSAYYQSVFEVTYYTDDKCTEGAVTYISENGIFTTGILDNCYASEVVGGYSSIKTVRDGDSVVSTYYVGSADCGTGPVAPSEVVTTRSPLNGCSQVVNAVSGLGSYYVVKMAAYDSVDLVGQVDLTQSASDLNAQIVGASVGVLCGFTTLLVIISMFGFFG